jgi:hypothetical protein
MTGQLKSNTTNISVTPTTVTYCNKTSRTQIWQSDGHLVLPYFICHICPSLSLSLSLQFLLSKSIPSAPSIPVHYILKHKEQSRHFVDPLPCPRVLVLSRSLATGQETNRWAVNVSMEHKGKKVSEWVLEPMWWKGLTVRVLVNKLLSLCWVQ